MEFNCIILDILLQILNGILFLSIFFATCVNNVENINYICTHN